MNKLVLMGRLTKDPEEVKTRYEGAVVKFTLAVARKFARGETDFFNCIIFNKRAEALKEFVKKGQRLLISGDIRIEKWEKDGKLNQYVQVYVDDFEILEKKEQNEEEKEVDEDLPF